MWIHLILISKDWRCVLNSRLLRTRFSNNTTRLWSVYKRTDFFALYYVYNVVIIIWCIYCGFPSERRRQLPCINHFLSSVSSDAIGQAAQQRGGHSHPSLDLHQITAGQTCRLSSIVETLHCSIMHIRGPGAVPTSVASGFIWNPPVWGRVTLSARW